MFIKICGLCDPQLAFDAAQLGADFIGMVFYEKSKRHVDIEQAKQTVKYAKQGGAQPVGVFVDTNADEIESICNKTDIQIAQLHGVVAKKAYKNLPKKITRIYVIKVNYNGIINDEDISFLNKQEDFLLYDGINYGSGKSFCLDNFKPRSDFRFFLSGGLNAANIKNAISIVNPYGVDVSTGVENEFGQKNIKLIKQFIRRAKT